MTKRIFLLGLLASVALPAASAAAYGRFERGRALVQVRCAPCLAMGWVWAPMRLDPQRPLDLMRLARTSSPAKVCTFMRRQTRQVKGPACYPGFISERDKLDMLYYLHRRAQGPIEKPRLATRSRFARYQGKPLRLTLAAKRASVVRFHKNRQELERIRRAAGSRPGASTLKKVTPPSRAPLRRAPAAKGRR